MDPEQYGELVMCAVDSVNSGLIDVGDGILSGTSAVKVLRFTLYMP